MLVRLRSHNEPIWLDKWLFDSHIRSEPDGELLGEWDISIPNITGGTLRLSLTSEVTQRLLEVTVWDLQATAPGSEDASGMERVITVLRGNLVLVPDVTYESSSRRSVRRGR
jgi:hypothetical protein